MKKLCANCANRRFDGYKGFHDTCDRWKVTKEGKLVPPDGEPFAQWLELPDDPFVCICWERSTS